MRDCVTLLKRINPLVADFKMVCQQFERENIKNGCVVISENISNNIAARVKKKNLIFK